MCVDNRLKPKCRRITIKTNAKEDPGEKDAAVAPMLIHHTHLWGAFRATQRYTAESLL